MYGIWFFFFFSSRRRHTRCALVTGVQTCALPIFAGKQALYAYCAERGIAHKRCGKLIVAADDAQIPDLEALKKKAEANGVDDLQWLSRDQALALEPRLNCEIGRAHV